MLVGIVVSNAIVMVDYLERLRRRGMERNAAIIEAGRVRLRPILMTAFATILAMLPLALGLGEGAESMAPLATVVIGGLLVSTFITLLLIPVVYSLFDDWLDRGSAQIFCHNPRWKRLSWRDEDMSSGSGKESKRELIIAAAIQVFSQKGYHHTKMEEIAVAAG